MNKLDFTRKSEITTDEMCRVLYRLVIIPFVELDILTQKTYMKRANHEIIWGRK